MSRPLAFFFGLMLGLTAFAARAETQFAHHPVSDNPTVLSASSSGSLVNWDRLEVLKPNPETALLPEVTVSVDSTAGSTLITNEAAESQIYLSAMTHHRWIGFTRPAVAPFSDSRLLPLLR